ncbi:SDR family oxidoreductase [Temperatibacter marinus]|uniref:Enoyl-[acyl-carrier-protein] reductase [NADH] n=1 Tax=Temperatibacter marinus TaxID=1456591 RepID=A0AA52H9T8_9PROT|nr:SDR family oxidoreductase [Temperatibacter marinus]WND01943.1 SDR family oxidoreductase [Temperatibacter marinus]
MTKLMAGKKGLIMGVANDRSMAWAIAKICADQGADIAFSYQGEALEKRVRPLAESIGSDMVLPCDVSDPDSMDALFAEIEKKWGKLDFVLHAIGYSDKSELRGRYVDTSIDNFLMTMNISAFSFVEVSKRAEKMMPDGGSLLTLSYYGAEKVVPHYNVMGVAKAALECSTRYLARDLGEKGIRVNSISAGPMKTLAASGVGDFRMLMKYNEKNSPLKRNITMDDIAGAGLYMLSDLSSGVTGENHHVDSGFSSVCMPLDEDHMKTLTR